MRKRIAEIAKEHLISEGEDGLMYGDIQLSHEIAHKAGMKQQGITTHFNVLNALDRAPDIFEKTLVKHPANERCFRWFTII